MESKTSKGGAITVKQWAEILHMLNKMEKPPRRILLWGKAGTGKTTAAMAMAPESERITLTQGQFPDALLGKFLLRDGSTYWANAPATRAAIKGVPLVLDEIHKAGSELDSTLQAILDDESVCRLNLDNGQTIEPALGFRVIATMNGSPEVLAEAVLDRFDVVLRCDTPHVGILRRLSPESAAFIANKMANEPDTETWTPTISPRRMLSFEFLRKGGVSDKLAAEIVFGEGQGKTVLMALVDAARNTTAGSVTALWTPADTTVIHPFEDNGSGECKVCGRLLDDDDTAWYHTDYTLIPPAKFGSLAEALEARGVPADVAKEARVLPLSEAHANAKEVI